MKVLTKFLLFKILIVIYLLPILKAEINETLSIQSKNQSPEITVDSDSENIINLGEIFKENKEPFEIYLLNNTSTRVSIREIKVSCGCVLIVDKPDQILPGERGLIRLLVDGSSKNVGKFEQTLAVQFDSKERQPIAAIISGILKNAFSLKLTALVAPESFSDQIKFDVNLHSSHGEIIIANIETPEIWKYNIRYDKTSPIITFETRADALAFSNEDQIFKLNLQIKGKKFEHQLSIDNPYVDMLTIPKNIYIGKIYDNMDDILSSEFTVRYDSELIKSLLPENLVGKWYQLKLIDSKKSGNTRIEKWRVVLSDKEKVALLPERFTEEISWNAVSKNENTHKIISKLIGEKV